MIEVLKEMVEALECALSDDKPYIDKCKQAIQAGKKAIAELESQEPWCMKMNGCTAKCEDCPEKVPQRTWVGLTTEETLDMFDLNNVYGSKWIEFARAVEAKLKEKNT
jgi:hypothetical protein